MVEQRNEAVFVEAPVSGEPTVAPEGSHQPQRIGRYRTLSRLGEGGFGVVFLAEQTEPLKRQVALKLIKPGMDSEAVLARFNAERQALAVMDHHGIAQVLDAGVAGDGRPYVVMEFVCGLPITEYCDGHRLTLDERIELLGQVCEAVQHAHFKGVVHRDLKPSNILVERDDVAQRAHVKIIDFGIAKAMHQPLGDTPLYTEVGQLLGTIEYMSPEQAGRAERDIDTRADLYSMGVVLYQLLTGTLPLESRVLRPLDLVELQRTIREVDPQSPSARVRAMCVDGQLRRRPWHQRPVAVDAEHPATEIALVASARASSPRALWRALCGDLDRVVMKCLEKDREARYATPNALVADLRRYLRHEPVHAGTASAWQRLHKFVRRHRLPVAAGAAVIMALLIGLGAAWVALDEARRLRNQALVAERAAEQRARQLAQVTRFQEEQMTRIDAAGTGARLRAHLLEQHRQGLRQRGVLLADAESAQDQLEAALATINFTDTALRMLDEAVFARALASIDVQFEEQPVLKAQMLQTLASTWVKLGAFERALGPQQRALEIRQGALGGSHADTLLSMQALGELLRLLGRYDEADPLLSAALNAQIRLHGRDGLPSLDVLNDLGILRLANGRRGEAEAMLGEALEGRRRRLGKSHPDTLQSMLGLSVLLQQAIRLGEAETLLRSVLQELPTDTDASSKRLRVNTAVRLGANLRLQHRLVEAEAVTREAVDAAQTAFGSEDVSTVSALQNLAQVLGAKGSSEEAIRYTEQVVQARERMLGREHPNTLASRANLMEWLRESGRLEEAEGLGREVLTAARRVIGPQHATRAAITQQQALTLTARGKFAEAEKLFLDAHGIYGAAVGAQHADTVANMHELAELYEAWHQREPDKTHHRQAEQWRARAAALAPGRD